MWSAFLDSQRCSQWGPQRRNPQRRSRPTRLRNIDEHPKQSYQSKFFLNAVNLLYNVGMWAQSLSLMHVRGTDDSLQETLTEVRSLFVTGYALAASFLLEYVSSDDFPATTCTPTVGAPPMF